MTMIDKGSPRTGDRTRRLLLVSYHFPPSAVVGALRWQRLTPIAEARGWVVDALTLAPNSAERIEWSRVLELPETTRIHGVTQPEPWEARFERIAHRIWRWAFPRDPGQGGGASVPSTFHKTELRWFAGGPRGLLRAYNAWLRRAGEMAWNDIAVTTSRRITRDFTPDLVLSCGPPHGIHEGGRRIARRLGVPFVMDMRDPWTVQLRVEEQVASPLYFHLAARDEARCMAEASLVVMNTPKAAAAMAAKWPKAAVISVMNGWDDEPIPKSPWPSQFRVVYAGSIYIDRSPQPLFRAIAEAVQRLGATPADFQVRLIGSVGMFGTTSVMELAREVGVAEYVQVLPAMPRNDVLQEYSEAAILLSLPQDTQLAIPSKVFEHIRQPAWVLAQSARDSATGDVLNGTSAFVVEPHDSEAITEILVRCYGEFRAGRRPEPIAVEGRFSRASEGARLFEALEALVDGKGKLRASPAGPQVRA